MLNLSFSEILLILVVAVFVLKPEDVPVIMRKFIDFRNYIFGIKNEVLNKFQEEVSAPLREDIEDMNKYLEKIIEIDGEYKGDYNISSVQEHYINITKRSQK